MAHLCTSTHGCDVVQRSVLSRCARDCPVTSRPRPRRLLRPPPSPSPLLSFSLGRTADVRVLRLWRPYCATSSVAPAAGLSLLLHGHTLPCSSRGRRGTEWPRARPMTGCVWPEPRPHPDRRPDGCRRTALAAPRPGSRRDGTGRQVRAGVAAASAAASARVGRCAALIVARCPPLRPLPPRPAQRRVPPGRARGRVASGARTCGLAGRVRLGGRGWGARAQPPTPHPAAKVARLPGDSTLIH